MDPQLDAEEKSALLATAREAIASRLEKRQAVWPPASGALLGPGGAFVTLHEKGSLRGCIGRMSSPDPLVTTIREMARAAAFEDPRFPALAHDELALVDIEITLLSPMRRIEDTAEIVLGLHGLYIVKGWKSGVFLPQVATEQGWDKETYLEQVCRKAGLPPDSWKSPEAAISIFEGAIFGEHPGE